MIENAYEIAGAALVLAGAAVCARALLWRHRSPFTARCCTARGSLPSSWLPWRVFRVSVCGYPLRGLPPDARGRVVCPECGRLSDPARPRLARAWRPYRLATACLVTGASVWAVPSIRDGTWTRRIPTLAVVVGNTALGDRLPRPIWREIPRRVEEGRIRGWAARRLAADLMEDLRDDGKRWTLHRAMHVLGDLGEPARPALVRALDSDDWQQRQAAGDLLRGITDPASAPDRLIRVTIEGLRDDPLPRGRGSYSYLFNAASGTPYLAAVGTRVAEFLREPLASDDEQQRVLCAIIAGFAGCGDLTDLAAPILVEHLRSNDIDEDAKICAPALYRLGPAAAPYLEPHVDADDPQLRGLARAILDALGADYAINNHPPATTPRVTGIVHDQVRGMTLNRMEWFWLRQLD